MTQTHDGGPKLTPIGWIVILVIVGGCFYAAYLLFAQKKIAPTSSNAGDPNAGNSVLTSTTGGGPAPSSTPVRIGIAYGSEKSLWFRQAVEEFAKTPDGGRIKIDLVPQGSIEGADLIVSGSSDAQKLNVWCPANSLPKAKLIGDWQAKYGSSPILNPDATDNQLALTPMVFVFWDDRYQSFIKKYKAVTFRTVGAALQEPGGWDAIDKRPEWGLFKFGHTHPNKSNSGLMTLLLMAYDYKATSKDLALKDILDPEFRTWLDGIERGASGLRESTGDMMREMVLKGPSSYDALFLYESVAIDYLKQAEGRWGKLRVVYPKFNAWNDNPFYVLDAPWSSPAQREAAETFHRFLLSEPIQKMALEHGFRPGNATVPVRFAQSPFVLYQTQGLSVDLGTVVTDPSWEVAFNLLQGWVRGQASR